MSAARAGQASAQLALGKLYLFGGSGTAKNIVTALYWLDRAAHSGEEDAWMLIGSHIPFETALRTAHPPGLIKWYERAFDAGEMQAALVFAKLILAQNDAPVDEATRRKAWIALEKAAEADIAEAQWLSAQRMGVLGAGALHGNRDRQDARATSNATQPAHLEWVKRAAENGVVQAQRVLAGHAWAAADYASFLRWSLPIAHAIAESSSKSDSVVRQLPDEDVELLSRCAQALFLGAEFDGNDLERFWKLAAQAGDKNAQFALGLWLAKMDATGQRIANIPRLVNYKQAVHWLTLAGQQGVSDAWYVLSKIYLKSRFAQFSLTDAERYLEYAAETGHLAAQLELGKEAWRNRRHAQESDVRAAYWLQRAAAQGSVEAQTLLKKIATPATPAPWAQAALDQLTANTDPFLAARIELAALFGLSQPEALLLDINTADRTHCLLVDIHAQYARSKRRLILIQTVEERHTFNRIARFFETVDCGLNGPEGNYRQRLYRLKTALSLIDTKKSS